MPPSTAAACYDGSHRWFHIFPLLCATLSACSLVQSTPVAIHFFSNKATREFHQAAMGWRLWDPGGTPSAWLTTVRLTWDPLKPTRPMPRRLWDPGVRVDVNTTTRATRASMAFQFLISGSSDHDGATASVDSLLTTTTMAARNESMAWHPGIWSACRNTRMLRLTRHRHSISADRPKTHDVASVGLLFCEAPTSATVQSIFHYSHPVLSRPTVPNIDT